jgi:hypothetical protein
MTEDTSTNNTMLNRKQATIIKIGLQLRRREQRSPEKHRLPSPKTVTYYHLQKEEEPRTQQHDLPLLPQAKSEGDHKEESSPNNNTH